MKNSTKLISFSALVLLTLFVSCKKTETPPAQVAPTPIPTPQELITTLRLYIWDSINDNPVQGSPFSFKDPDGDGGQAGSFLNNGLDSLIKLNANTTYKTRIIILDETKTPTDSISSAIAADESWEHLIFYNGNPSNTGNSNGNVIIKATYPDYTVKLNGSEITLRYTDTDNGTSHNKPTQNIGLETYLKTSSAKTSNFPLIVTLRHQPDGAKDGTYLPGETDVDVYFKIKVN